MWAGTIEVRESCGGDPRLPKVGDLYIWLEAHVPMKAIDKMAVLPSAHVAGWQHALVTGLPYAGKAGLRLDHPDGLQDDRM